MIDQLTPIGSGSIIQHGTLNDRIYLMKLAAADADQIIEMLDKLAESQGYTKIICKIPKIFLPLFIAENYAIEGFIPGFYNGEDDALFVSRFLDPLRAAAIPKQNLRQFSQLLAAQPDSTAGAATNPDYSIRRLDPSDVTAMAAVYTQVFDSYPFPIFDTAYLLQTMASHIHYYGAFVEGTLAALASSEINFEARNAEMTDFATHPQHTGKHLAGMLLQAMERQMNRLGITTLHTMARLNSIPMNKTFLRAGYRYSGTLINNTHIAGGIESLNIYYKHL